MHSRRAFLRRGVAGSIGIAGGAALAGCFDDGGDDGDDADDDGDGPDDLGDRFYDALADPTPAVVPSYFVGYDYDVSALLDVFDPGSIMPVAAGALFENVVAEVEAVDPDDVGRIVASRYRQVGSLGEEGAQFLAPEGEGLHATGDFEAEPFAEFFAAQEIDDLGTSGGYRRFGVDREQGAEVVGLDEGSYVFGERLNTPDAEPGAVIDAEIDAVTNRSGAVRDLVPEFVVAADLVAGESIRSAAQYDLVTLGADTGVTAFDDAVVGLSAGGVGVTIGDSVEIERGLVYVSGEYADADAVEAALSAGIEGDGPLDEPDADWSVEADGRTVVARTTVDPGDVDGRPATLQAPIPAPGYDSLFEAVDPSALGRQPVPRVALAPEIDEGRIRIRHADGPTLEDLSVRYTSDGEGIEESWPGPVDVDDEFRTEETVDPGTELFVVWRPDTVDAAILLRVGVPA